MPAGDTCTAVIHDDQSPGALGVARVNCGPSPSIHSTTTTGLRSSRAVPASWKVVLPLTTACVMSSDVVRLRTGGVRSTVTSTASSAWVACGPSPALVVKEHSATEALLRQSGLIWTALRDSQYTEAMVEAAAPISIASGRWPASAGDGKVGFVTRRDCAAVAVAVMTTRGHENTAYNITGPELLSFRDVAAIAAEVSGHPIEYVVVDDESMYRHFDALGIPRDAVDDQMVKGVPWSSNDMVSFEQGIRGGFMAVLSDDVEKLTGQKPQSLRSVFLEHQQQLRAIQPAIRS